MITLEVLIAENRGSRRNISAVSTMCKHRYCIIDLYIIIYIYIYICEVSSFTNSNQSGGTNVRWINLL